MGCRDAHHETFESIFGAGRKRRPPGWSVEKQADTVAQRIGGNPPADELAQLSQRLRDPGAWLTLIHGDPCPDNALLVAGRIRLIDYEFARPAHALLDAAYWRIGFPTCWCAGRIPPEVGSRVEAVYRAELGKTMPVARDDAAYRAELAFVAAIWLFTCLEWRLDQALEKDESWGIASLRSRLLWYLEAVADITATGGVLPGLEKTVADWLTELRKRWPDASSLGFYPAFLTSAS